MHEAQVDRGPPGFMSSPILIWFALAIRFSYPLFKREMSSFLRYTSPFAMIVAYHLDYCIGGVS